MNDQNARNSPDVRCGLEPEALVQTLQHRLEFQQQVETELHAHIDQIEKNISETERAMETMRKEIEIPVVSRQSSRSTVKTIRSVKFASDDDEDDQPLAYVNPDNSIAELLMENEVSEAILRDKLAYLQQQVGDRKYGKTMTRTRTTLKVEDVQEKTPSEQQQKTSKLDDLRIELGQLDGLINEQQLEEKKLRQQISELEEKEYEADMHVESLQLEVSLNQNKLGELDSQHHQLRKNLEAAINQYEKIREQLQDNSNTSVRDQDNQEAQPEFESMRNSVAEEDEREKAEFLQEIQLLRGLTQAAKEELIEVLYDSTDENSASQTDTIYGLSRKVGDVGKCMETTISSLSTCSSLGTVQEHLSALRVQLSEVANMQRNSLQSGQKTNLERTNDSKLNGGKKKQGTISCGDAAAGSMSTPRRAKTNAEELKSNASLHYAKNEDEDIRQEVASIRSELRVIAVELLKEVDASRRGVRPETWWEWLTVLQDRDRIRAEIERVVCCAEDVHGQVRLEERVFRRRELLKRLEIKMGGGSSDNKTPTCFSRVKRQTF